MARSQDERSLGELFAELSRETGVLVRKEVELATTEMTAKARTAAAHVGTIAAGGALAHAGLLVLLAACVIGLAALTISLQGARDTNTYQTLDKLFADYRLH